MATGFNIHDQWLGDVMPQSGVAATIGRNTADGQPAVPVRETHCQALVTRNTNLTEENSGSGTLSYDAPGNILVCTPTFDVPDRQYGICPSMYYSVYDAAGGQGTSTSLITLNLDTEIANSHPEVFSVSGDLITINASGTYKFDIAFTARSTRNRIGAHIIRLQNRPPGGSFANIPGAQFYQLIRQSARYTTGFKSAIVENNIPGTEYRVRVKQNGTTTVTLTLTQPNTSLVNIVRIG